MKLLLLGLPGAGKGTVGKQLATFLSVPHISVGDRVRELAKEASPIGERLRQAFAASCSWAPLADELAMEIAETSIIEFPGWILDGFPRNTVQAGNAPWLDGVDAIVLLAVSEAVAQSRVLGRNREGDGLEKFTMRMAAECERLSPLIELLRSRFTLIEVDADEAEIQVVASVLRGLAAERKV